MCIAFSLLWSFANGTLYLGCGAVVCLVSVVCMTSLDLVASELENPFGEDDNDLFVYERHESFNSVLVCRT